MPAIAVYWAEMPVTHSPEADLLLERLAAANIRIGSAFPKGSVSRLPSLAARALLTHMLEAHHELPREKLQFGRDEKGRPILEAEGTSILPNISISHVLNSVAVAVSAAGAIGVDVENLERKVSWTAIARRYFSPAEWAELRFQQEAKGRQRFFELWTQKEAIGKVTGDGVLPLLMEPIALLSEFSFKTITPTNEIVISTAWRQSDMKEFDVRFTEVPYAEIPS